MQETTRGFELQNKEAEGGEGEEEGVGGGVEGGGDKEHFGWLFDLPIYCLLLHIILLCKVNFVL